MLGYLISNELEGPK